MGALDGACRIIETRDDGDRCLIVDSAQLRLAVNVDYGAHIYELLDRPSGTNLLHRDPLGSRRYRVGGWFELFPNAGAASTHDGYELSRGGDIQRRPWTHRVRSAGPDLIELELTTHSEELPLRLTKTITVSSGIPGVHLAETVTNLSDVPQRFLWGQHVTFGAAFMTASSRIDLPDVDFGTGGLHPEGAPYARDARGPLHALPGAHGGTVDLTRFPAEPFSAMVFSDALPEHWYNVWADDLGTGLAVGWDGSTYPALWLWATRNRHQGDPSAVACAIEPQASAIPSLADAVAAGEALVVEAGRSRSSWIRAVLHHDPAPVTGVAPDGTISYRMERRLPPSTAARSASVKPRGR